MPELPELSLIHIPATRSDKATQSHSFQSRAGNFQTQDAHAWRHKKVEICFESDNQLE